MNTEVEIHVGQRQNVLAIPNAALRTQRDVASAAQVLGLDPNDVQQQLAAARPPQGGGPANRDSASLGGGVASRDSTARRDSTSQPASGNTMTTPDGRTIQLPPGVTEAQVRSAFQKRMSGQQLTPAEQNAMTAMRAAFQRMGGGQGGGAFRGRNSGEQSSYIVFALKKGKPTPVQVRTGLTDLDYVEVVNGLSEQDTVLVLPSASLVNAQRDMQQRMRNITGGGLPGVQQQQPTQQRPQATPARP
jgi:HlyD family secretion protein